MRFNHDPEWQRNHWRPGVGERAARSTAHRVPKGSGAAREGRRARVWSYTHVSVFDYEVHRVLFGLTVRRILGDR